MQNKDIYGSNRSTLVYAGLYRWPFGSNRSADIASHHFMFNGVLDIREIRRFVSSTSGRNYIYKSALQFRKTLVFMPDRSDPAQRERSPVDQGPTGSTHHISDLRNQIRNGYHAHPPGFQATHSPSFKIAFLGLSRM